MPLFPSQARQKMLIAESYRFNARAGHSEHRDLLRALAVSVDQVLGVFARELIGQHRVVRNGSAATEESWKCRVSEIGGRGRHEIYALSQLRSIVGQIQVFERVRHRDR